MRVYSSVTMGWFFSSAVALAVTLLSAPNAVADLTDELVAHYTFDEASGLVALESSGVGTDGELFNFPDDDSQWVTGQIGGALNFDGADDFVIAPQYELATTGLSVSAWVWANSAPTWASIVKNWGAGAAGQFHFGLGTGGADTLNIFVTTSGGTLNAGADTDDLPMEEWQHVAFVADPIEGMVTQYRNGDIVSTVAYDGTFTSTPNSEALGIGVKTDDSGTQADGGNPGYWDGMIDDVGVWTRGLTEDEILQVYGQGLEGVNLAGPGELFAINGGGETYLQDFDIMETGKRLPKGWRGEDIDGTIRRAAGLGLTDGFLTVPGNLADGVLGVLNLGGNADSFGPAPDGFIPTWTAELAGATDLFGQDDAVADSATDRALGVSRENNNHAGELNFEIVIADNTLRAFVFDWDLEIWGGDPDGTFRSAEGPGMKVDVSVGGNSYDTMAENFHPGDLFDSTEDGSGSDHNATLIDGNVHSIRGITSGIKEVSDADGAIGNMVQINFDSNWNSAVDDAANGWISAVDNVRLRALAPGDADANGVVDVADLLQLLGGQKFNQGVDGVTWEQGDFNADDQFDTGDLLAMLSFLSGTFPSDPYASEAGGASDAVADVIVNSETGEVTVDLAGHTVSAILIESTAEIFNGEQPQWNTASQFPSTLPGELGNVLFTSTASGVDELGAVISSEFLGRDKEFYLQDLDLNILIASEGGALTKGNVIVVPEPSTWMLLGLGSLAIVGVIRRRMA